MREYVPMGEGNARDARDNAGAAWTRGLQRDALHKRGYRKLGNSTSLPLFEKLFGYNPLAALPLPLNHCDVIVKESTPKKSTAMLDRFRPSDREASDMGREYARIAFMDLGTDEVEALAHRGSIFPHHHILSTRRDELAFISEGREGANQQE